jgi:hypothetical protein
MERHRNFSTSQQVTPITTNPLTFKAQRRSGQRHCSVQRTDAVEFPQPQFAVTSHKISGLRGITAITICEGVEIHIQTFLTSVEIHIQTFLTSVEIHIQTFLTSVSDGGEPSTSFPERFTLGLRSPGTFWTGGWMGQKADTDAVAKRR